MKAKILAIMFALMFTSSAWAGRVVMNFSDSRGGTGTTSSWPVMLDNQRTDFIVCNKYKNGRDTAMGVAEISDAITQCQAMGEVTDGIILLGVASMISGISNDAVANQIRTIAATMVSVGIRPWIILEPPGPLAWGGYSYMDAHEYTRANVQAIIEKNAIGPRYGTIDIRGALLKNVTVNGVLQAGYWYRKFAGDQNSCSNDDLHPTNPICRQQIFADTVSKSIP